MTPDRDDLRDAVKHVCYELQRARQLPAAKERAERAGDAAAVAACFEACYLHLRNLLEFLDQPKPDRISAVDYAGTTWAPNKRSEAMRRLRRARDPINAHISHLLWKRVTTPQNYGAGDWEIADFIRDAEEVFGAFLDDLDVIDAEAAGWFRLRLAGSIDD